MPKVFLITRTNLDTVKASEFGELNVVFSNMISPYGIEHFKKALLENLEQNDFNAEDDYIVLTGSINHCCLGVITIYEEYGQVKILMFDSKTESYKARVLCSTTIS